MKPLKKYAIPVLLTLTVLTTLFLLFSGVVGASQAPGSRSPIPGHTIPALAGRTPLGATDGQQMLSLSISLKLADPAGLQGLIQAQNDRHSPLYHQYLTPAQFTAHYAPGAASVDAVVNWLRSQGLTVQGVATNHLSIKAQGTVATVERAFDVHIANYSLNGHIVYAPTGNPSVPTSLAGLILNVGGLDNVSTPHRMGNPAPETGKSFPGGGPNGGGYTPSNLRTAYDMNPLVSADNGANQTVALLELDGYTPGDITTYLSQYGLGAAKFSNVLVDGATGTPSAAGGALEVELDMEVVSAIAPGASQLVYMAPNTTFQNFYDDFSQIVTDDKAQVVSDSWGLCELDTGTANMAALDAIFQEGAAQGQAFFAASGDAGSVDCNQPGSHNQSSQAVDFPASDPNVVGVGGTELSINSTSTYKSETAWYCSPYVNPVCAAVSFEGAAGGGGLSIYFGQPSYQTGPGVINMYSKQGVQNCSLASYPQYCREVPDVSADASQNTPYSEYCTDSSGCGGIGWIQVFGTSAAAPLWAGVATDLNEYLASQSKPTLGSASEPLYWLFNTKHPYSAYHDITTGSIDPFITTSGYDLATGIGTPDVWNIARDFAAAAPSVTPDPISLATTSGTDPGPQIVTITNSGYRPYHWSLGLPTGITANVTTGTTAPNGSTKVTLSFSLGNTPHTFTGTVQVNDVNGVLPALSIPVTVVEAQVSRTWYFAEGYTGGSFSEYLSLANPNNVEAQVQVTYLLGSGATKTKTYGLGGDAHLSVSVNHDVGQNQNVSMVVSSDQPIVAERPMYFTFTGLPGYAIPGGTDVLGATALATSFDFGYLDTTAGHATYLTILNQNSSALSATVHYYPAAGGSPITRTHSVAAHSRGTVFVNGDVPRGSYSALVTLSQPGLVERPLYLKDSSTGYTGAADVVGVATPQKQWDFAEGYTSSTFTERYILSNPGGAATAHATVTFFRSNGTTATRSVTLAPGAQAVVSANSVLGSSNVNNSAQVTSDQPILAERFISFKYVGPAGGQTGNASIPGASDVLGANAPGNLFYFAEGYTGATFAEYLTIENPNPTATATVQVTFLWPTNNWREPVVEVFHVGHSSRFTLFANSVMKNQSFSMVVESNVAIVAERPMYFIYSGGGQTGGSDVIGYQPPGSFVLPG